MKFLFEFFPSLTGIYFSADAPLLSYSMVHIVLTMLASLRTYTQPARWPHIAAIRSDGRRSASSAVQSVSKGDPRYYVIAYVSKIQQAAFSIQSFFDHHCAKIGMQ